MGARVFISCGQREGERDVAQAVAGWLTGKGFQPYVALEAQSIQDVNTSIIGELRRSDYYIFIDFRRDPLSGADEGQFRGSLFSHQELAIAYTMGFEYALFFREKGVKLEGMCAYIASNATPFEERSSLPELIADAVELRGWSKEYSRNLIVGPLRFPEDVIQYGGLRGRFLYVDIQNHRRDIGAAGVVARLSAMKLAGCDGQASPNRSHLKVTGQQLAFVQTIWPNSHGAFDLLCIDAKRGSRVYLNSALDISPIPMLFDRIGDHILEFEVFAHGFELLPFTVRLHTTDECSGARATLEPEAESAV
jgi:hypothetical protein